MRLPLEVSHSPERNNDGAGLSTGTYLTKVRFAPKADK